MQMMEQYRGVEILFLLGSWLEYFHFIPLYASFFSELMKSWLVLIREQRLKCSLHDELIEYDTYCSQDLTIKHIKLLKLAQP